MTINFLTTLDLFFSLIPPNLLEAVGVLIELGLLIVAIWALNTWRKEMKGGNEYQVAFNLLLRERQLCIKLQKQVRNPFLRLAEGKSMNDWNWEKEVYVERLNSFYEFKNKFYDEAALRAEILFGEELKPLLKQIDDRIGEIYMAFQCAYNIYRGRDKIDDENAYLQHGKKIQENKELLWNQGDKDEFNKKMESSVLKIEEFLYKKMD